LKIFWSFLIIFTAVCLWIIPFTDASHTFKTDVRLEEFTVTTGATATNTTIQLFKDLYQNDTSSIDIDSHDEDDAPTAYSYNATSRVLMVAGLAVNTARQLDIAYDIDAMADNPGIAPLIAVVPMLWILMAIVFPIGGLVAMWWRR
jgi:hypothetical protein